MLLNGKSSLFISFAQKANASEAYMNHELVPYNNNSDLNYAEKKAINQFAGSLMDAEPFAKLSFEYFNTDWLTFNKWNYK